MVRSVHKPVFAHRILILPSQSHCTLPTATSKYRALSAHTDIISGPMTDFLLRSRFSARQSPRLPRCATKFLLQSYLTLNLQNFLALCASGYFDNTLWHRNIKGFMIQTGDPSGSGKGGQSIWGKPFPDELRSTLKVLTSYHPSHRH